MMYDLLKMHFGKLCFSFADDQRGGGGDPIEGNVDIDSGGNVSTDDDGDEPTTPTDFVDFEGAKVPLETFERMAKERYKEQFDAYENREKWQRANTQRAQEINELKRKAEAYERMSQDRSHQQQPTSEQEQYVQSMLRSFPDVDPNFLRQQFEWMEKMSGQMSQKAIDPIVRQQAQEAEMRFLQSHPDLQVGSPEYQEIANLVGRGASMEQAYNVVFQDKLLEAKVNERIKKRDEEAKRKLKQSHTSGAQGVKPKGGTPDERAWDIINQMT